MISLTELNKKIKSNNRLYWMVREQYVVVYSLISRIFDRPVKNKKKRILFYHINSLGYAGTEKFLQILAKYSNKNKYDVYFLYPNKIEENTEFKKRLDYLKEGGVIGLPFDYKKVINKPPYFVSGMNPDIQQIINALHIDLLVIPDAGNANYPFSVIKNIPIILLNIFGQPNLQKNIKFHLCISKEVGDKLSPIVPENKVVVFPVPSEGPTQNSLALGQKIRENFNIKDTDTVFGRIGRPDNAIFDPIGIRAFQKIVKNFPSAHYIIMSPPPILVEIVKKEQIPNVHFLPSSAKEEDVWAFHQSIDAVAHFRNDGESFGLNIVESMLCGKPVITHKSHIWNAHLEYLEPSFSRIANKDDVEKYALFMKEFILLKQQNKLKEVGVKAREKSEEFLIENQIVRFEKLVDESIVH